MGNTTRVMIPSMLETVSTGGLINSIDRLVEQINQIGPDEILLEGLVPVAERIFLHDDEAPRRALLVEAQTNRRLADFLVGRVFPGVARLLDTGWSEDRLSFVDVTIAATRLQDAVRALGRFTLPAANMASLLMIVPQWEQHFLPAAFAAEQFRNLGAPTRLLSGLGEQELINMTRRTAPSAIMISTGSYRSVARVPVLIDALRRGVPRPIPIVIGGPAILHDGADCRRTGADLATNDLASALKFCDFTLTNQTNAAELQNV